MASRVSIIFSNCFRLIWIRLPFIITHPAAGFSLANLRSLFSPIRKYLDASSMVRVYFSQIGTSVLFKTVTHFQWLKQILFTTTSASRSKLERHRFRDASPPKTRYFLWVLFGTVRTIRGGSVVDLEYRDRLYTIILDLYYPLSRDNISILLYGFFDNLAPKSALICFRRSS